MSAFVACVYSSCTLPELDVGMTCVFPSSLRSAQEAGRGEGKRGGREEEEAGAAGCTAEEAERAGARDRGEATKERRRSQAEYGREDGEGEAEARGDKLESPPTK